jgi:hypothetical protein
MGRRCRIYHLATVLTIVTAAGLFAQSGSRNFNERLAEKKANAEDTAETWVLDFHWKDPRVVTVDIPGKGKKTVWYLSYDISNNTGAPRSLFPSFVWVCHNQNTVHSDQLIPSAVQRVQKIEDPSGRIRLRNSVTISAEPIPFVKEFNEQNERISYPKLISGIATWDDIHPKCSQFSIFVYGLSNGAVQVDGPDGKPVIRRKTLQLKYKRVGDEFSQSSDQIRYAGQEWIYATTDAPAAAEDPKPEK